MDMTVEDKRFLENRRLEEAHSAWMNKTTWNCPHCGTLLEPIKNRPVNTSLSQAGERLRKVELEERAIIGNISVSYDKQDKPYECPNDESVWIVRDHISRSLGVGSIIGGEIALGCFTHVLVELMRPRYDKKP